MEKWDVDWRAKISRMWERRGTYCINMSVFEVMEDTAGTIMENFGCYKHDPKWFSAEAIEKDKYVEAERAKEGWLRKKIKIIAHFSLLFT